MVTKANKTRRKPIHQYTIDGVFIKSWPGFVEIIDDLGIVDAHLTKSLKDPLLSCGGSLWRRGNKADRLDVSKEQVQMNLEWRRRGNKKPVHQITEDKTIVWPSVSAAARVTGDRGLIDLAIKSGSVALETKWIRP